MEKIPERGNPHGYGRGFTIEKHRDELIDRLGKAIKLINKLERDNLQLREALEAALSLLLDAGMDESCKTSEDYRVGSMIRAALAATQAEQPSAEQGR